MIPLKGFGAKAHQCRLRPEVTVEEIEMADAQPRSAAERDLRLLHLDHFNVPVRDLNVARRFYCDVLGGAVIAEPNWRPHEVGRYRGAHLDIQLFNDEGHINAYWQPWGQPAADQLFPHRAFRVSNAAKLDEMIGRLEGARVPYILATRQEAPEGVPLPVSLYFRDPDGNQLELRCAAYPFGREIRVSAFDPTLQYYPWRDWRETVAEGGAPGMER
jgi:catechol 2,3-dioxygenase-like lactoylglutathione lyase family enzyme